MSGKQAKRRRKEQRERARLAVQQPEPTGGRVDATNLEDLLENGDIDTYAQTCWTIANTAPMQYQLGDTVDISGPCEEHGEHTHEFLLTPRSMLTISQCAGMETCGDAIRLISRKLPPELLPCNRFGHRDQLEEFFYHGIEPHECIYCGETPEFINPSKSLGWPGVIPVKGIDGNQYTTCPKCGSDSLELRGEKLNSWGWNIVCMDCEWTIKQAELLDIKQYCDLMEAIKRDLNGAISMMESTYVPVETRVHAVGVQTRRILERIGYAALISNKDSSGKSHDEMKAMRSPRDIFKNLEKIHPNFFPQPVEIRSPDKGADRPFFPKIEYVLTREKLLHIYRELNPLAHSANPLDDPIDYDYYLINIPGWLEEIANTLSIHQVMLHHHPDHFYIVKMDGDVDGSVQCTPFSRDMTEPVRCAWPDCVSDTNRTHCEFWGRHWAACSLPELEPDQTEGKGLAALIDLEEAGWANRSTQRGN